MKINCWLCRNVLELGDGIGYYFDYEMNLRCEKCDLPIGPATEEAEAELQKFLEPTLKLSFTHVNYNNAPYSSHGHGHGIGIPKDDSSLIQQKHPFHHKGGHFGQCGPLGEEWNGYDGGG